MKYFIGAAVIIGLSLYFFRSEFFIALDYIDKATQAIAEWIKNK